jgi:hypothetical protein
MQRERERESKEKKREKKRQERECMTLVDKHRAKREISLLGYGYEERARKGAKRERETGREVLCLSWDDDGWFFVVVLCLLLLQEAGGAPTLSFASSVCLPVG